MAFAKFNQCNPCCNCTFTISYASGGNAVPGITITIRDIRGSGIGSCVTDVSGVCVIPIRNPGVYYAHNDYCNTTQMLNISQCGNDVAITIPCASLDVEAHSECFFDVPLTRFTFEGPSSYEAEASGNILIGSLPFPQLAALVTMPCPRPSGIYTVTVEDVNGDHYPKSQDISFYCSAPSPRTSMFMWKKWGYSCAPGANIDGCPAPGITISDTDGHTATTGGDGSVNGKWKYDFPDGGAGDPYTYITASKGGYISADCGGGGCQTPKPRCASEPADCTTGPFGGYGLTTPAGFWGAPTDGCLEAIPATLNVSFTGFTINGGETSAVVDLNRPGCTFFPYNYAGGAPTGFPFACKVLIGVHPGCITDINAALGGFVSIGPVDAGANFPAYGFGVYTVMIGTSACPTMFSVIEYNSFTNLPTGRSVTVSN